MKISNEVYKKLLNNSINAKQNKYHNKKTIVDGIKYDSKKESRRSRQLEMLERLGVISNLKKQVKFELQPKYEINGKKVRAITYIADFIYYMDDKMIVEDVKSEITKKDKVYRLKKKMFEYKYNLEIEEV